MTNLFKYVLYFLQADTKEARKKALLSAKRWCLQKHGSYHWTDAYRIDMIRHQRAYMAVYCDLQARKRLDASKG